MVRIPRRTAAVGLVIVVLASTGLTVGAFSDGRWDRAREGCGGQGCHIGMPDGDVTPEIDHLPEAYEPGRNYTLVVAIEGGRDPLPNADNAGGFNLLVSAGRLYAVNETVQVRAEGNTSGREATHTTAGNDQRSWEVAWVAPANGSEEVTIWLAVNAVNGNGFADALDQWNTASFTVAPGQTNGTGADGEIGEPIPDDQEQVPGWTALVAVVAVGAAALVARRS